MFLYISTLTGSFYHFYVHRTTQTIKVIQKRTFSLLRKTNFLTFFPFYRNLQKDFTSANNKQVEESAILIQKIWRGYKARRSMRDIAVKLQNKRTQDYIEWVAALILSVNFFSSLIAMFRRKLTHDMETTKVALENERKIQQLQMQAISALWKKVSTIQTSSETPSASNNSTTAVHDLAKTCSVLTNQVRIAFSTSSLIIFSIWTFPHRSSNCKVPWPKSCNTSQHSAHHPISTIKMSVKWWNVKTIVLRRLKLLPFIHRKWTVYHFHLITNC